jgi:hypothetical protein
METSFEPGIQPEFFFRFLSNEQPVCARPAGLEFRSFLSKIHGDGLWEVCFDGVEGGAGCAGGGGNSAGVVEYVLKITLEELVADI